MTMIELAAAAAVLAVLLACAVQMIRVLDTQRRFAERRTLVVETTQSLLEQLTNTPWDQLTPSAASELAIPDSVKSYLPGAAVVATVVDEQNPVAAKRVSVELKWNTATGLPADPVRLTTWVYENE